MPGSPHLWIAFSAVGIAFLYMKLLCWHWRVKKLPPGPPKLPFIDNLHNCPRRVDWVQFHDLGKQHNSDIIHIGAFGFSIVVLNTFEAAQELLNARSRIYSSRLNSVMLHELSGLGNALPLIPYGDHFRACRRIFSKYFGVGTYALEPFVPTRVVFYTRRCLQQLLETPDNFLQHLQYSIASISLSVTYGLKVRPSNDDSIMLFEELAEIAEEILDVGAYMVDAIPALKYLPKWFPGARFRRQAELCSKVADRAAQLPFQIAEEMMQTPDYVPSFVSEHLKGVDRRKDVSEIRMLRDLACTVYGGATETTSAALGTFMLAMVCHPDVQKKAQDEVDAVVCGRLPEYDEVAQLPYLTAVFMEVLRWKSITPVGVPHANTEDDIYNGYMIPAGSVVIGNQWAMLQDPTIYSEPSEFRPDRFIKDGQIDGSVRSPLEIAFGFGRRMCPVKHIAQSAFMVLAASILSTFDLLMKTDENGQPIRPTEDYHLSVVSVPKDFPCLIVPRSSTAQESIISWANAEGDSPP